ncbi:MAG: Hpt domain-containing protein [Flavobacteriaceae bacterium]|nr:Hpt domain-containing protein [Bacteroidia bacterium]NNL16563.1 Hpt domain-containing protein [Flavobacteriaceae bacterium]
MEEHYKLHRVRELADNDEDFIQALIQTFLEEVPEDAAILEQAAKDKNYLQTYQSAHKMKPTIDLFELGVLEDLIEVQDWGKYEQRSKDITEKLDIVMTAIRNTVDEIKEDFNL